jgi:hypothetical protein
VEIVDAISKLTSSGEFEKTSFLRTGDTSSFWETALKLAAGCSRLYGTK